MLRLTLFAILAAWSPIWAQEVSYGVDCSFPMHSTDIRCGELLGDRQQFYEDYMDGCRKHTGSKASRCDDTERDRIEMNLRQPQSMVNYTATGFSKIRAPSEVMKLLNDHWEKNKDNMKEEVWPSGSIYVNYWDSPTYMAGVEDRTLVDAGEELKSAIWNAVKPTIEQWTGMEQTPTSLYGIRKYTTGALLSPHVDRLPLVSSCIINIDQDVDEPWPLEVIDRAGNAVNVTMEPGDMVLYESHSLIHSRPFPLKGRFLANIFVHFEPTGRPLNDPSDAFLDTLDEKLPPYVVPGSLEADNWLQSNPRGWEGRPSGLSPILEGHVAASLGNLDRLAFLAQKDKMNLLLEDENGWQPIHEAARGGFLDIVKMLLENGADKNARVGLKGEGGSVLNIALENLEEDHPVVQYLISLGAENIEDELQEEEEEEDEEEL